MPGRSLSRKVRSDPRDLASRDVELMSALERSPGLRGLAGVHAIEDEGLGEIGAIACREDTRPQVVVLALEERRVVAKPVPVQVLAIHQHRGVEERRAEEEMPANRSGRGRHRMDLPGSAVVADSAHGGSENDGPRSRADTRQLALEPPWKRDVVGIQARDVPPSCLLQPSIQRAR